MNFKAPFQSIIWNEDRLTILDQTYLPGREIYIDLTTEGQVWDAIKKLKVRGAPAIGIAGAYGLYLGLRNIPESTFQSFYNEADRISEYLNSARPTAVNLSWALKRLIATIYAVKDKPLPEIKQVVLETAQTIHAEDRRVCNSIGEHGVELVPEQAKILTHCNTGGLATGEYGTAFSILLHAHHAGKLSTVWVDETRPLLQGSRLTTWELKKAEIPFKLNIDSAAGFLMQQKKVDLVIVGADRITKNGDAANKIGTYSLAVLANAHNIPFYIAAPTSSIDMDLEDGQEIEIEQRDDDEVTSFGNKKMAPTNINVYNPAFDVTPHHLITAIITEKGVIKQNYAKNFENLFG